VGLASSPAPHVEAGVVEPIPERAAPAVRGARRFARSFRDCCSAHCSRPLIAPALVTFMVASRPASRSTPPHPAAHRTTSRCERRSGTRRRRLPLLPRRPSCQAQAVLSRHPKPGVGTLPWIPLMVALVYRPLTPSPLPRASPRSSPSAACVGSPASSLWRRNGGWRSTAPGGSFLPRPRRSASVPAAWNYRLGQTERLLVLPLVAGTVLLVADRRFVAGLLFSFSCSSPRPSACCRRPPGGGGVAGWWWGWRSGRPASAGGSLWLVGPGGIGQWLTLLGSAGPAIATSDGLSGSSPAWGATGPPSPPLRRWGSSRVSGCSGNGVPFTGRPLQVVALGIAASLLLAPTSTPMT